MKNRAFNIKKSTIPHWTLHITSDEADRDNGNFIKFHYSVEIDHLKEQFKTLQENVFNRIQKDLKVLKDVKEWSDLNQLVCPFCGDWLYLNESSNDNNINLSCGGIGDSCGLHEYTFHDFYFERPAGSDVKQFVKEFKEQLGMINDVFSNPKSN